jgi:hypothetical protein
MTSADHDHVIGHDNAVPAACCGDGTKGAVLAFGGARSTVAAAPNEGAGAGLAPLGPEENRASGQASSLYPANNENGRADKAVPVVQVQHHRDVLPMVAEQVSGERNC